MKICSKCNKSKEENCFSKDKHKSDGLRSSCKQCDQELSKAKYVKKREVLPEGGKKCCKCKIIKNIDEFGLIKGKPRSQCKICRKNEIQNKERKNKWYENNKERHYLNSKKNYIKNIDKIKNYKKEYNKINKESISLKSKERYKKNRESILEKSKKKYMAKKSIKDKEKIEKFSSFSNLVDGKNSKTVRKMWRKILARYLRKPKKVESLETRSLLGYSYNDFKKHIESLWLKGMSWDNYGKEWHVDHIIPLNLFPLNTDISVVNSLSNLRPLWTITKTVEGVVVEGNLNRSKGKIVPLEDRPVTLFLDIDGCLVFHNGNLSSQLSSDAVLLPGVKEKFAEWDVRGYKIILTTGRKESCRKSTEKQLNSLGLFWDQLVMGLSSGQRVIINDLKPNSLTPTAVAINIIRNVGFEKLDLDSASKIQQLASIYGISLNVKQ
jgi:hypothetical protein